MTDKETLKRLRGLKALLEDAVKEGSSAVERVHLATARRPFAILEKIPPLAVPVRGIHVVHDATVAGVYGMIRLVNGAVGKTLDVVLDAAEAADATEAAEAAEISSDGDSRTPDAKR